MAAFEKRPFHVVGRHEQEISGGEFLQFPLEVAPVVSVMMIRRQFNAERSRFAGGVLVRGLCMSAGNLPEAWNAERTS